MYQREYYPCVCQTSSLELVGVGVTAFGLGIGEATIVALTSFYHEATSRAFSAGTGAG